MKTFARSPHLLSFALIFALAACSDDDPPGFDAGPDAGPAMDGGSSPDGGGGGDAGSGPDGGGGQTVVTCMNDPIPMTGSETCSVTSGSGGARLVRGAIVAPEGLLENGHLLIGADGKIACAACDCSGEAGFADATVIACPSGVVSPGLINAHEHVTFGEGSPIPTGQTRYDHRHEWRTGARGAMSLDTPSGSRATEPVLYSELRHLLGGATSIAGSGGASGLLRNLDRQGDLQEGLGQAEVEYSTFPLGDVRGTLRENGCDYGNIDAPTDSSIARAIAYLPHISEGVDQAARNEFICLSRAEGGGQDVLLPKTAFIHGVGMTAVDYAAAAAEGASLVWSPRTNISLYGFTAPVTLARALGVNIALGTDWPSSGSQNMLRELRCASRLNTENYGGAFTDRDLVDMATVNAASALKTDGKIGSLRPGLEADVAIFDATAAGGYRAIIEGEPATVALVMRSGEVLYGDAQTVAALRSSGCEPLDVCMVEKSVCAQGDAMRTVAELRASVSNDTIALFACGEPVNEPTCIPFRSMEFMGVPMSGDQDGDGISDMLDNCPAVFNAPMPLDQGVQADVDGDMTGDACDVCPLDANSTDCTPPDPADRDADMVPNAMDNCPDVPNTDQADGDMDGIGDVCDRCPMFANPGNSACPATIYEVKQGSATGEVLIQNALVSGVGPDGYFLQVVEGDPAYDATLGADYSGIFVFDRDSPRPSVGDRVDLAGTVNVFFGQTQIAGRSLTVNSTGGMGPAPTVVAPADVATGGARAEALEGVLIEVQNVVVTDAAPDMGQFNEFIVDGSLRVNDFLYLVDPFPVMGQSLGYVRGLLRFANDDSKVEPRGPNDVDQAPVVVGFEPSASFALENQAQVSLRLRLNRQVDAPTAVALSATGPAQVASMVTVPMGADAVDVPVTTAAASTTPAQITATLGMSTTSASIRVYSETEPRSVSAVRLASPSVTPGGTVMGTVELDLPAPSSGQPVSFSVRPSLATISSTVSVPAGQRATGFSVVTGAMEGMVTITASVGASSAQASLQISSVIMGTPSAAGDVVITEIMKNPSAVSDTLGEWFELHNPSASVIQELQGCTVSDAGRDTFDVTSSLTIPPGGYVSVARSTSAGFTADFVWSSGMALANGDDEVILTCGGVEIDRVEYDDPTHPDTPGASMQLSSSLLGASPAMPPHVTNDTGSNWCSGTNDYNGGDLGTPGAANAACP